MGAVRKEVLDVSVVFSVGAQPPNTQFNASSLRGNLTGITDLEALSPDGQRTNACAELNLTKSNLQRLHVLYTSTMVHTLHTLRVTLSSALGLRRTHPEAAWVGGSISTAVLPRSKSTSYFFWSSFWRQCWHSLQLPSSQYPRMACHNSAL